MGKIASFSRTRKVKKPKTRPAGSSTSNRHRLEKARGKGRVAATRSGHASNGRTDSARGIRTLHGAMEFIDSLINYERKPPSPRNRTAYTLGRIKHLLADLENPHKSFRSVHIAGTKGKGSTATMLSNMLQGSGYKVGLYTSPHILDIRERISVNGALISEAAFVRLAAKIARVVARYKPEEKPTYFEALTVMAFQYFHDAKIDIAVVEVGLGGRLDATNIVRPEVCGITSISLDHMAQLGNTIEAIAEEKAGIFKEGVPIISAPQPKSVKQVLRKSAEKLKAPVMFAGDDIEFSYRFESSRTGGPQARICVTTPTSHFDHLAVPLVGEHQAINCGVALGVLDQLKSRGFAINDEAAIAGLSKVRMQGRMEMLCSKPRVIADGAHNAASIDALMRAIGQNVAYDSMVVIFGCCADKDVPGMLRHIQLGADKVIFTRIDSPRAADPVDLAALFAESAGRMAQIADNLEHALQVAEKAVGREDLICITGSFYLVSEAKEFFAKHPHRHQSIHDPAV